MFEHLTPEEQEQATELLQGLPNKVVLDIGKRLASMPIEQGVGEARQMLMMTTPSPADGAGSRGDES